MHGPHHREVFQGHLRGAVGTDLGPGVGAAQPDVRRGDGRHPDEVVGAGEERGEGGGEGDVSAHGHADGGGDELLLGDVHLEVALGMRLGELLGVGGVAHLPVEGDDVAAGADRGQRLAEGQPGGDLGTQLVAGQAHLAAGPDPGGPGLRPRPADREVPFAAQLGDGPLGHFRGQRPAVPALAVLDLGEPAALDGSGRGSRWAGPRRPPTRAPCRSGRGRARRWGWHDSRTPQSVWYMRPDPSPARSGRAGRGGSRRRSRSGCPAGSRPPCPAPPTSTLPPSRCRRTAPTPGTAAHRDTGRPGPPRPRRAAPGRAIRWRRRPTAAPGSGGPPAATPNRRYPCHQLLVRDDARRLEHGVQQRGRVPLGEDQVVVGRVVRLPPVVAEIPGLQHRHHVGGRHARRRMTGPGGGAAPDRIDPQLLGQLAHVLECLYGHGGLLSRRGRVMPGRAHGDTAAHTPILAEPGRGERPGSA